MKVSSASLQMVMALVAVCYAVILCFVYTTYVSPIFAYQGMVTQEMPLYLILFQIMLAVAPAPFLSVELDRPSEFQTLLLYIIAYVPSVIIGYHICEPDKWGGYTAFSALLGGSLVLLCQVRRLPPLRLPIWLGARRTQILIVIAFTVVAYAAVIVYYGAPEDLFDIAQIYKSRADFKDRAADVPSFVNYLYWWQGVVINPVIIITGMLRRNLLLFLLGVVLESLLFSLTTLRTMLLTVVFCIFMVAYLSMRMRRKGLAFLSLVAIAMTAGAGLMSGEGALALGTRIFVQRWLAIQGQLSGAYFDFFADNGKAYLGNSILRDWVVYRYGDMSPGEVIGDAYVSFGHGPIANATANFWADAFGQFGFLGVLGATVVAGLLLWVVDSAFRKYPRGVAVMLFSTCALSLTEQGVQMALLTGGILPLLLIALAGQHFFTTNTNNAAPYRSFNLSP